MASITEYGLLIVGCALGIGIGFLIAKNRYSTEAIKASAKAEAQAAASQQSKDSMKAEMESIASMVARQNSEDFLKLAEERLGKHQSEASKDYDARKKEVESLVEPIKHHLEKLELATNEMEKTTGSVFGDESWGQYNEWGQKEVGSKSDGKFSDELQELIHNFGIEYWPTELLAVRAGYVYDEIGEINNLTYGFGIRFAGYGFDFSYLNGEAGHPLTNTLRFSLNKIFK